MTARRGEISRSVGKLLTQLHVHKEANLQATSWVVSGSRLKFQHATIEAAYERHLVKIIVESGRPARAQRKKAVELTEIGKAAALGLIANSVLLRKNREGVSIAAQLMIQEALCDRVPGDCGLCGDEKADPSPTRLVA